MLAHFWPPEVSELLLKIKNNFEAPEIIVRGLLSTIKNYIRGPSLATPNRPSTTSHSVNFAKNTQVKAVPLHKTTSISFCTPQKEEIRLDLALFTHDMYKKKTTRKWIQNFYNQNLLFIILLFIICVSFHFFFSRLFFQVLLPYFFLHKEKKLILFSPHF